MRFLLDQNVSPQLVVELAAFGHDAVHVRELGMSRSLDVEILELAHREGRVIVSSDTDFGELLARTNTPLPSVVLLRRQGERRAAQIAALLEANLEAVADDLDAGAIVVLEAERIRIRRLPMRPETS